MAYKKCEQYKCTYRSTIGDCPVCDECNAGPHIVNDGDCVNCWCCVGDEGYIRSGKSSKQILSEIIVELENKVKK